MATENVKILDFEIKTGDSVKNVHDLQENIRSLKKALADERAQEEDNQKAAELLRQNQAALRDAMYDTTATVDDLVASSAGLVDATGKVNGSYNDLVHTMAELKSAWRATTDETERARLGTQIDKINSKLKELDASTGNFSRNVGDYRNAIKDAFGDMSQKVDVFKKSLGSVGGGLNGMKDGLEGISKSPAVATVGILVSLAMKLASELKDNEKAMEAVKKAMSALKPVMDFLQGVLDTVIDYVVELIEKAGAWLGSSGFFNKLVDGLVGVGNAILKFVIAPFKGIVAAIKVFQDEGVKGIGRAAKAFAGEMKNGVAFKSNFQAGQAAADAMVAGMESRRKKVADTAGSIAKEAAESSLADWEKALAEGEKRSEAARKLLEEQQKEMDEWVQSETDAIVAEIDAYMEEQERLDAFDEAMAENRKQRAKEEAEARKEALMQSLAATSSILSSLADMYETETDENGKNAKKAKALRIAGATIDMLSGVVTAISQAQQLGPIAGPIAAAANSAAVIAAGVANIAKMKAVNPTSSSSVPAPTVSAPNVVVDVPRVRNMSTESDLTQLNRVMDDIQVYVLDSDIQAKSKSKKVKVQEASF